MKDTKLHIVGLEALDEQCQQLANGDPGNPDYVNKCWFMMHCFKVLMCPKRYSHDWGACPYAHNNESARRRDPQRYNYSSCICPNTGKGECPHGDQCRYAHTLFEYWLHPARFRTQMCKAGANCKRALCFFAHSQAELRHPDKADSAARSSVMQLASAAAAMAAGPVGGAYPACPGLDGLSALPLPTVGLAVSTTGLDSNSSNVSCATQQPGTSPTALNDFTGDLNGMHGGNLGSSGNLQLHTAPATAGLLAQMPLLGAQYPSVSAAGAASSGLVTSMPQLQDFLQQQRQQQLVAGMAAMNLTQAPVLIDQLQPSAAIGNLCQANMPASSIAAVAAPIYSSVMQGVPVGNYVRMGPASMMQQAVMPSMALQQVYQQPGGYRQMASPGLQYAWM